MRSLILIARREFIAYVTQPVAYVFVIAFTVLAAGLAFHAGRLLERGEADLLVFFQFHPWLYLVLMPAIGMRLWAAEYRSAADLAAHRGRRGGRQISRRLGIRRRRPGPDLSGVGDHQPVGRAR